MNTSLRNWQKARLAGFCLNITSLSSSEIACYKQMLDFKELMLKNWDKDTEKLIGHKLPPHKCSWCNKRSTKQYLVEGVNFCYGHSKTVTT